MQAAATDLDALLGSQRGLASTAQLRAVGLTGEALRWRLDRGWRRVLPRVVYSRPGDLDAGQRLTAAALYGGTEAVVSSLAAARWHGVTAATGERRIQLEVPARRNLRGAGFVVVRRTVRPDAHAWPRGTVRIASPARAVMSAAADARNPDQCRAMIIEAVQRGICSLAALRHELEDGPRSGSAAPRRALQEAEAGAWSVPEADLLEVLVRSRAFLDVWANPDLWAADGTRLPRPDCWLDDVALAVQVHSRRYHAAPDDWDRTVMSDGIYAEHGVAVLRVTPTAVAREPQDVLQRIVRAHRAAARRPRPDVLARRRSV